MKTLHHTETTWNGRKIIIDAADLTAECGYIEVMAIIYGFCPSRPAALLLWTCPPLKLSRGCTAQSSPAPYPKTEKELIT